MAATRRDPQSAHFAQDQNAIRVGNYASNTSFFGEILTRNFRWTLAAVSEEASVRKRILVVDDDPQMTSTVQHGLEGSGTFTVRAENDPKRVIEAATEFSPDLLLLDVIMPEIDGTEVAAKWKDDVYLRNIPIVFVTGLVTQLERHTGSFICGTRTYLPKPIELGQLIEVIEEKLYGAVADDRVRAVSQKAIAIAQGF